MSVLPQPLLELEEIRALAPAMVDSEIRQLLGRLRARRRKCDQCGRSYLQKQAHTRGRSFCGDYCRWRYARALAPMCVRGIATEGDASVT